MRIVFLTSVVVLFSACGFSQPFEPARDCHFAGFGAWHMEKDRGCAPYEAEAKDAKARLLALGWVKPEEAAAVFSAEVWVHNDTPSIVCQGTPGPSGCYVWGSNDIETDTTAASIEHEYLHRLDDVRGMPGGPAEENHVGWKASGFWDEGRNFQDKWYGTMIDDLHLFGHGCSLPANKDNPLCAGSNERLGPAPID